MVPTEAAIRLHAPLDEARGLISRAMQEHAQFEPATARRGLRLSMSDVAEF